MDKNYDPQKSEKEISKKWEKSGAFSPAKTGDPFVIAMPPPNVTGQLHAGHAMFLAIEDLLTRHARMRGRAALWVPGTDHAAIATESVVLKNLGVASREEFSREEFLQKCREWTTKTHATIKNQIQKMGASCDWSREAFTFDEKRNFAVNEIFKKLFEKGLIYRGNRLVNWSVGAQSVLADDELEFSEVTESFFSIKCGEFVVGTVRPETKCADSPVVVHPTAKYVRAKFTDKNGKSEIFIFAKSLFDDKNRREKELNFLKNGKWKILEIFSGNDLVGKKFDTETFAGKRKFFVIADEIIDPEKGTGAMTISAAHSADDYDLATRLDLKDFFFQKIDFSGKMTEIAGPCAGLSVEKARKKSAEIMREKNLLVGENKNYLHRVPKCYRTHCVVEPMISRQWFIAVEKEFVDDFSGEKTTLKKMTADAVREKFVEIVPDRFEKTYFHWIDHLRDWCISRQIWWGHRVPVFYDKNGKVAAVGNVKNPDPTWRQDEDTLDTWFSSATWPFSIFEWPAKTADFERFYPTTVLETGHDILFFWVARMIMFGKFATGKYPFKTVYLHGMVRDEKGQKMSKSKGNGIDPLEIAEKFGTDALRLSLILGSTPGNNVNLGTEKIAGCRHFCNKLWNISRFLKGQNIGEIPKNPKTDLQKWILEKREKLIFEVSADLEKYFFGAAAEKLWEFSWNEFADVAIEAAKAEKNPETNAILRDTLKTLLKLWHPFIPFVTEKIWEFFDDDLLISAKFPEISGKKFDGKNFEIVKKVAAKIRSMRKNAGVDPTKKIVAFLGGKNAKIIEKNAEILKFLARLESLNFQKFPDESGARDTESGVDIFLPSANLIDPAEEARRRQKELSAAKKALEIAEKKLQNPGFLEKAPKNLVEKVQKDAENWREKIKILEKE